MAIIKKIGKHFLDNMAPTTKNTYNAEQHGAVLALLLCRIIDFLILFLLPFFRFIPFLKERNSFEKRWRNGLVKEREFYDWIFHASSEGELEQVRPLLELVIKNGDRTALIFTSPSVERNVRKLQKEHSQLLCYPVTFLSFSWSPFHLKNIVAGKRLVFCRYDFLPQLFAINAEKLLVSASLINKVPLKPWMEFFYRRVFQSFEKIVPVSFVDRERFVATFPFLQSRLTEPRDFRVYRILDRLMKKDKVLEPLGKISHSTGENVLLAQVYSEDLKLLDDSRCDQFLQSGGHLFFAPHRLDQDNISRLKNKLIKRFPDYSVTMGEGFQSHGQIHLLIGRGVLLEVCALFNKVYVGGGLHQSIHSVLEPFLAGAFCAGGPFHERSTEWELIEEESPERIHEVLDAKGFWDWASDVDMLQPLHTIENISLVTDPVLLELGLKGKLIASHQSQ